MDVTYAIGNSASALSLLRPAALWAGDHACMALAVFEDASPGDMRPREAIQGAREFGCGGPRDAELRKLAWAAHAAAKGSDHVAVKYAARSAMLAAAVAYTHTDLNAGRQGVNQARHILGSTVYTALACEASNGEGARLAGDVLQSAAASAPKEVVVLLHSFPPQPCGTTRLSQFFHHLDARLRLILIP